MSDIGALNAFPPEWWPGRREIDPDSGRPDGGHCPYARPLQLHWSRLADGTWTATPLNPAIHCHDKEWAHFEGEAFQTDGKSKPVDASFAK